jgi:hypothetical protein
MTPQAKNRCQGRNLMSRTTTLCAILPLTVLTAVCRADQPEPLAIERGRVTEVRPADHTLTIHTHDGRDLVLHADDSSIIRWHRDKVGLADLRVGARVRVWYRPGDHHLVRLNPPLTLDDVKNDLRNAAETAKDYTYQHRDEYQKKMNGVMHDLDEQIEELKEKARAASADAKTRYDRELADLARQRDALRDRLTRLRAAAPDVWTDIKSGVSAAARDLRDTLDKVKSHMDSPEPPAADK